MSLKPASEFKYRIRILHREIERRWPLTWVTEKKIVPYYVVQVNRYDEENMKLNKQVLGSTKEWEQLYLNSCSLSLAEAINMINEYHSHEMLMENPDVIIEIEPNIRMTKELLDKAVKASEEIARKVKEENYMPEFN